MNVQLMMRKNHTTNLLAWECPKCNHGWQLYVTAGGKILTDTNPIGRKANHCYCGHVLCTGQMIDSEKV
jgi:hypothetical protein